MTVPADALEVESVALQIDGEKTGDSGLLALPDEIIIASLERLPVADVLSAGAVCRRLANLSTDSGLVRSVLVRDFGDDPVMMEELDTSTWAAYESEFKAIVRRRMQREKRRQRRKMVHAREALKRRAYNYFNALQEFVVMGLIPPLAVVGCVLIPLRLDGQLDWRWSLVMWPWFAIVAVVWLAIASIALVQSFPHYWMFDHIHQSEWSGIISGFSRDVIRVGRSNNAVALLIWICVTAALGLLAARLDGAITWCYGFVFTPLWIVFVLVCLAPFTGWVVPSDRASFFATVWIMGMVWFLTFTILLTVHLDAGDSAISLAKVFVPLWTVDGFFIGMSTLVSMLAVVDAYGPRDMLDCTPADAQQFVVACGGCWLLFGPLLAFKVLILLRTEVIIAISWMSCFLPLIIWMCGLCAISLLIVCFL